MEAQVLERIKELIKKEHLDGLIGTTHSLILKTLSSQEMCATEIFEKIRGQNYLTAQYQVVRAIDQLTRIGCVKVAGKKKTGFMAAPYEPSYAITENGYVLQRELERQTRL
jgi:hypothetical protein